jgi:NAD+ synthase (glutamine-hydrolysing)
MVQAMNSQPLKIAVAQINCTVGDLDGNSAKIVGAARQARQLGAHLLITPELSLCGYPPEDLLLRDDFYRFCAQQLAILAQECRGIDVLVGHPLSENGLHYNAASLLRDGEIFSTYRKHQLPNFGVFDEVRYFVAGEQACVVDVQGIAVGITICADVWESEAAEAACALGAEILVVINASPFHVDKQQRRYATIRERIRENGVAILYCNLVGGQDELVFDGGSFAINSDESVAYQTAVFEERLDLIDYREGGFVGGAAPKISCIEAEVYAALTLGVRDYVCKNNLPGGILGFSGGVNSALTLCIAVDALGADKVSVVMMPSSHTDKMGWEASRDMVRRLGVRYKELPIESAVQRFEQMQLPGFEGCEVGTTEAQIRGVVLMALSNMSGSVVLATGNKTDMAVGYAPPYEEFTGGLAVIKDISKTMVYRLCVWRNGVSPIIPDNILASTFHREINLYQKDRDSLPAYKDIDAIIEAYVERNESPQSIIASGYSEYDVRRIIGMLRRNECKRRQAPMGIRVTPRGFGKDWRCPITNGYADEF